jgi:hypothetical protein
VIILTAIGLVPLTTQEAAVGFVLNAVRLMDRDVAELAADLCRQHRPPDLLALDAKIAELDAAAKHYTLWHQEIFYRQENDFYALKTRQDELLAECQSTAIKLIQRLARADKVVIDGDIVRAV